MREWAADIHPMDKALLDVVLRPLMEDGRLETALRLAVAAARVSVQINPAAVAALREAAREAGMDATLAELDLAMREAGLLIPWDTRPSAAAGAAPVAGADSNGAIVPRPSADATDGGDGAERSGASHQDFRFKSKWVLRALRHTRPSPLHPLGVAPA